MQRNDDQREEENASKGGTIRGGERLTSFLREEFISAAVPSKNRPHPASSRIEIGKPDQPSLKVEARKSEEETVRTCKQSISGENSSLPSFRVLEEVADAILSVTRGMDTLDVDAGPDFKGLVIDDLVSEAWDLGGSTEAGNGC